MGRISSFLLIPDTLILLWMVLTMARLQHRSELKTFDLWARGLFLIVCEDLGRFFYGLDLPLFWHNLAHFFALGSYLSAGMLFLATARRDFEPRPGKIKSIFLCGLPSYLLLFFYTFGWHNPWLFAGLALFGLVENLLVLHLRKTGRWAFPWLVCVWLGVAFLSSAGMYRYAAYALLAALYLATSIGFAVTLPARRYGKALVVVGFGLWSLCFLAHPVLKDVHTILQPMVSKIWDLQRYVVTFGLLILSLEELGAAHEYNALHDALTGLPNRRLFADRLQQSLAQARRTNRHAVLFNIDLNGFKKVNDTWGHAAGDFLLREVASRMRLLTRESDTLCRMGGDEFCLLVSDFGSPEMMTSEIVERELKGFTDAIRQRIEGEAYLYSSGEIAIELRASVSIGAAIYPDQAQSLEALCLMADQQMYNSKHQATTRGDSFDVLLTR